MQIVDACSSRSNENVGKRHDRSSATGIETTYKTGSFDTAHCNLLLFFFLLARWFPSSCERTSKSSRSKQSSTQKEVLNIRQFLLDQRKQKELAEGIGIEDDTDDLGNSKIRMRAKQEMIT